MRPIMGFQGSLPYFGLPNGGPSNPMPRPGSLGGNNGGGLATTVNSLPPQIESLSSALQNINELANQLTGGIGALMGSLQGNENAPGLGITDTMQPGRPTINHTGLGGGLLPYRPNRPAIGGGILGLQQGGTRIPFFNPLQQAGGQM
jgi:hypothetical protein